MKLTPLEVKQKKFRTVFRGAEVQEVEEFLQIAAEDMEDLVRENNDLKERLHRAEERLEEYKGREQSLKETLLTAQKMAEDVKSIAEREAKNILSNAELEGERVVQQAMNRRERMITEIHDLKRQKVQFESSLRSAIDVHLQMLDALKEHEQARPEDENLTYLKRRSAELQQADESETADDQSASSDT
jgi:cell division initiation protein